jgi:1-aminocyclopropane-1-carboxylate deaminase/D-cysteine desulfhydrase-like pyridoxal-dependent ACC family enzyme
MSVCSALGTWGYIEAAAEVLNQQKELNVTFDDIVVSIGSGGTAAGLAAGFALSKSNAKVYGMCACDDTNFFHDYINKVLFSEMKPPFKFVVCHSLIFSWRWCWMPQYPTLQTEADHIVLFLRSEDVLTVIEDYKGIGYAKSTKEELEIIYKIARDTSVLLDPVYSGKAAIAMIKEHDRRFRGRRVLFIHTGGGFGMYEKTTQLKEIVQDGSTVSPMYK